MKLINCDWLQCHIILPFLNYEIWEHPLYTIVKDERSTQQFKALYHIYSSENEIVATLTAEPRAEMFMPESHGILKIENKYLYQPNAGNWVKNLLKCLGLTFLNYCRLDFCLDFYSFDTMPVREFIENFESDKYLKTKRTKYQCFGETKSVNDKGELTGGKETMSFGMKSSKITYKLYNKSKEQAQKKLKPWIIDAWNECGYNGDQIVWRLEFQVMNDRKGIILDSGKVLLFSDIHIIDYITDIWLHFYNHCFQFVHKEKTAHGTYKKQSRCTPVTLFTLFRFDTCKYTPDKKKESSTKHKILLKNLEILNNELRGNYPDIALAGNMFATWVLVQRGLESWAQKKLPTFAPDRAVLEYMLQEKVVQCAGSQLMYGS